MQTAYRLSRDLSRRFVKLDAPAAMALRDRTKCHLGAVLYARRAKRTARKMASDPTSA